MAWSMRITSSMTPDDMLQTIARVQAFFVKLSLLYVFQ